MTSLAPRVDPQNTIRTLATDGSVQVAQKTGPDQWLLVTHVGVVPSTVGDEHVSGWHKHARSDQCGSKAVDPYCVRPASHREGHSAYVLPWDYQDLLQ